jgi:predicted acetylornithine/succinylornithine family transaminase
MTSAVELTQEYVAQTYKRPPFVLTHGKGMKVWDEAGKEYLDMVSGIAVMALGHSDTQVAEIIQEQAEKLIHVSNLYYTTPQAQLAQLLCEKSFADRVFFCNSGAEANEACIKFARKYAFANNDHQRREIVSFSNAFHGRTMGALAVTPKEQYQKPFQPLMGAAKTLPFNDIAAAEAGISSETCAVLVEPIQGEGGVYPASVEFIQNLRRLCDERGALLVFDEVQCGLGRTGTLWAYEQYGVTPDLMALAKPLAAGLPMGACLMTAKVHSAVAPGDHGSTFAAGALVSAVAKHVLERVSQPEFLAHVNEVGVYLWERLHELNAPQIVEIRGRGLMVGMELNIPVGDIVNAGYEHGLLLAGAGTHTLRFVPPLIMEKSDVDTLIERLEQLFVKVTV